MTKVVKHTDVSVLNGFYSFGGDGGIPPYQHGAAMERADELENPLTKARDEAKSVLESAKALAGQILENASQKAKTDRAKAREEGYREGLRQGRSEGVETLSRTLKELEDLMTEIEEQKCALLSEHEDKIKNLAIEIAEKLVNHELIVNNDAFVALFETAVQELNGSQWIKVMVSDQKAAFATAYADMLLAMVKDAKEIKVLPLEDAPVGTLIIETQQGFVDAGVDTQIGRMRAALAAPEPLEEANEEA